MLIALGLVSGVLSAARLAAAEVTVTIDGKSTGKTFEGLGALSAGASSRLLLDYPEPQRSRILDFLFLPNFGAAFHHLKVEIGGDVNSTDGTEPSHARTREEFEHPRPEYFERGYEWWLMREARKRNPQLELDVLQWGAPGWIGGNKDNRAKFFSQDNADFIVSFLKGARQYHGLDIGFCGIWNETPHDAAWIKRLRKTLDRNGLDQVKIVASDQTGRNPWDIAREMQTDPALMEAVYAIGAHYVRYQSTASARATGKRLYDSEDGPWRGDWPGAAALAKMYNRNYIEGRMTKTVIWSLVTSYYDILPLPNSGPMLAKEPWSGHYEVQPALWAIAHTTQFAQTGWRYLDSSCGFLPDGGSYVALRGPRGSLDYSVIIETIDARSPQTVAFQILGGLSTNGVQVWHSNQERQFEQLPTIVPVQHSFSLGLQPASIYSLTTTTGQQKGKDDAPTATAFPCPYRDDFESYPVGKYAKYFSDQGGVFEVANRPDGPGHCLRQTLAHNGIDWHFHLTPEPYSLIGSPQWRDYEVSVDVLIERRGSVSLWGRVMSSPQTAQPAQGYWLKATDNGQWELHAFTNTLAVGSVAFASGRWHNLKLRFVGTSITVVIDGQDIKTISDSTYRVGMTGVGSGWNTALFDNFAVRPLVRESRN